MFEIICNFLDVILCNNKKIRPKYTIYLGLMPSGLVKATDDLEECISCIFRVEEKGKQANSVQQI
jgi:hypothetical protein